VPLYEYKCLKCARITEKIERVSGPHLKKCPHCSGKVEPMISRSAIQFKGSGWYVTDYAAKKSGAIGGAAEKAASETTESKDTKEKAAKDTPAKETPVKEKKSDKKK
jgi:putative FmdB family regulatory protein